MSKFLRFIVNLFIIVAVLTAAAILIPPLAGVNTTIVDSASMDTNLPLGSITYSRSVARSGIEAGDEVLRETSGSVYAYVIEEVGENGTYTAVSAADSNAAAQTIELGDPVLRVAVIVPWIGYVVMALQSTEGILILVLIAVLVIVLFILSELWKPDHAEEEEEPAGEAPVPSEIHTPDDGGIDTAVIRQAMNENNDQLAKMEPEDRPADFADAREEAAAPAGSGALPGPEGDTGAEENAAPAVKKETEMPPAETGGPSAPEDRVEAEEAPETGREKRKKSWRERRAEKKAEKKAEKANRGGTAAEETPYAEEAAVAAPDASETAPSYGEEAAESVSASVNDAGEDGSAKQAEENRTEVHAAETSVTLQAEDVPQAEAAVPETPSDPDRFIPVGRPTLGEILDEARKTGDKPKVKEDEATGITTVDYTDVL